MDPEVQSGLHGVILVVHPEEEDKNKSIRILNENKEILWMASQHLAADPQQLEEPTPGGSSDSVHRREKSSEITLNFWD